jgi:glycosyltransferase involved in cell wall biosynthesis
VSGLVHAARTALRVVRGEGARALVDRALDRLDEWRDARLARPAPAGGLGRAEVLNVLGMPAVARLGGVPLQLRDRMRHEALVRPCALLSRAGSGLRLERSERGERRVLAWRGSGARPDALVDPEFEAAVARALGESGARVLHFEGLAGVAPVAAEHAANAAARLVVTVHDFTPFCPRPHLWEATASRFCGFSTDPLRCQACLARDFDPPPELAGAWRGTMARLLARADALVFPSEEMRAAWRVLLPSLDPERQQVIAPGVEPPRVDPRPPGGVVRHAAFVGAATEEKGALLVPGIARAVADVVRVSALGGGRLEVLQALRAEPGIEVRGYYRAGTLSRLLRERAVDVALLLSLVPESHGLTLDECWRAGVPVIAFDHGAVAGRVRRHGGGVLVPLAEGATGVAAVLRALVAGARPLPAVPGEGAFSTPAAAADAHVALYRRLIESGR